MRFIPIDMETWERKEYYEYYTHVIPCRYSLTANIEITKLLGAVKERGLRFYPTFLYVAMTAVNQNKEMRMVKQGDVLGYWEEVSPTYTIFHQKDHTFSDIWTAYDKKFSVFYQNCVQDMEVYGDVRKVKAKPEQPANTCPISCVPWLSFTGYSLDSPMEAPMLMPILTFGKYFASDGKIYLPFSLYIHHSVADGYHSCKLFQDIERIGNQWKDWMDQ